MSAAIALLLAALLAGADQLFKFLAVSSLADKEPVTVIRGVLSFEYVENSGAAFGSFEGGALVLGIITALIIAAMAAAVALKKIKGAFLPAVVMIIAGGIGNVIDRFRLGYVVDFIRVDFIDFPVFNFADILVTCGCVLLMIIIIVDTLKDAKKRRKKNEQ